jgi:tol-pal system protein YbgF
MVLFLCINISGKNMSSLFTYRFFAEKIAISCAVMALTFGVSLPSYAQDSVEKRVKILEKQLRAVQRKVFTKSSMFKDEKKQTQNIPADMGGGLSRGVGLADMEARIAQIETELRLLTGKIEENEYRTAQLEQKLEAYMKDSEFRFTDLETAKKPSSSMVKNSKKETSKTPPAQKDTVRSEGQITLPSGSVMERYNYAYSFVRKRQYVKAEHAFTEFLVNHPKDKLAGNAQFWLGQTYYVRKMYDKASRAFIKGYETYPKSPKIPGYLLKIGMSLAATGDKELACGALDELKSSYPNSPENQKLRASVAKKLGCK